MTWRYQQRASTTLWSAKHFAFYGAMLGIVLGVIHAYVHGFWSGVYGDFLVTHILSRMVLFVVAGSSLLAAVSVIRNWLVRDTEDR
jgi:hypothetical protein